MHKTLVTYAVKNECYYTVTQYYLKLLEKKKPAVNFVLAMLIKSALFGFTEKKELWRAMEIVNQIFATDYELKN